MKVGPLAPWSVAFGLVATLVACGGKDHSRDGDGNSGRAGASTGGASHAGTAGRSGGGGTGGATSGGSGGLAGEAGDMGGGTGGDAAGQGGGTGALGGASAQGGGGTGGDTVITAGSSGARPADPAGFTLLSRGAAREQLDLLFMIDNSISMFQKQALLAEAVPVLMRRLAEPDCVDADGKPTGEHASGAGVCPSGTLELAPVRDVHVGIITSSLGDHGSDDICGPSQQAATPDSQDDDHAQLLPSVRSGLTDWNGSGFLLWDPRDPSSVDDPHTPLGPNETDLDAFTQAFVDQVQAVGEHGCGYEGTLEAWYRFLVDPSPVLSMSNAGGSSTRGPVNSSLLAQRAAFLRPDSTLAIVMMSDENDCSVLDEDGSQGWLVSYKGGFDKPLTFHMPEASSACDTDPADKCCRACTMTPQAGCPDNASDPVCSLATSLDGAHDALNLRCFEQKRRFGVDLLYSTDRYVEALTSPKIHARSNGLTADNPLFSRTDGGTPREPANVVLMGILGVPWQDISTADSWDADRDVTYLSASELSAGDRWKVIVGDDTTQGVPTDSLMVEAIDPRTAGVPQKHPLLSGVAIGDPSATTNTNPINGHEHRMDPYDLQYACIFPLQKPVTCDSDNADGCDCNADEFAWNSPVCQGGSDTVDGTQVAAKAYPSLRELEVLRGLGDQGVVTSICAKNTTPDGSTSTDPAYGFNPAVSALVARLARALSPSCMAGELDVSDTAPGGTRCHVAELESSRGSSCDCASLGRSDPSQLVKDQARQHLETSGLCSDDASCNEWCVCEVAGLEGAALDRCQGGDAPETSDAGFCYVDPAQGAGDAAVVASCPPKNRRTVRFVGDGLPTSGATLFAACEP